MNWSFEKAMGALKMVMGTILTNLKILRIARFIPTITVVEATTGKDFYLKGKL